MKLLNSLYTIRKSPVVGEVPCYGIRLNPDHVIYRAHFPEMPITPGVCIVQIAQELLEVQLHRSLKLTGAKNVKFLTVITPREVLDLDVVFRKIDESSEITKAQCIIQQGETVYAKLSLQFQ